jgi:hypothetical protein
VAIQIKVSRAIVLKKILFDLKNPFIPLFSNDLQTNFEE